MMQGSHMIILVICQDEDDVWAIWSRICMKNCWKQPWGCENSATKLERHFCKWLGQACGFTVMRVVCVSCLCSVLVKHEWSRCKDKQPNPYVLFPLSLYIVIGKATDIPIQIVHGLFSKIWWSPVLSPRATQACAMGRPHAVLTLVDFALPIWRLPGNHDWKGCDPMSILLSLML